MLTKEELDQVWVETLESRVDNFHDWCFRRGLLGVNSSSFKRLYKRILESTLLDPPKGSLDA